MSLSIGADVGETNTTAVILKEKEVLCSSEVPTTQDVTSGIIEAIELVLKQFTDELKHNLSENFEKVSIGTTQFENAVKQRKDLSKVALFRLCYPATIAIPPLRVPGLHKFFYLNGGCETDGTTISHVDEDQLTQKTREVYNEGITHIAIVGVYSPKYNDQEDHANRIISCTNLEMKITVSHKVCDEEDFLKREQLSIMNESLRPLSEHTVETLSTALTALGLKCPFYFTRSDGKLISFEDTRRLPVLTLTSGLTNSMRGAAFLTGVQNGIVIVIDIGGTTMHVGSITDGLPKHLSGKERKTVGQTLTTKAFVFSGKATTATDIAVASPFSDLGDKKKVRHLSQKFQEGALEDIKKNIQAAIDQAKPSDEDQSVIVVGGGAVLLNPDNPVQFKGASKVSIPQHFQVANAVGAAVGLLEQYTREPSPLQHASILLQLAKLEIEETVPQTEPFIDPATGDWILKKYDIECITLAAGIMACGGGGNTQIGKLRAMASLERDEEIRVVHPSKLGTVPELSGRVAVVALMGNPVMVFERLISGLESVSALKKMEEGHCPEEEPSSRTEPVALLCIEMGGISTTEPLATAGRKKIPIVDADGMGRANPKLGMFLPYVYGSATSFSAIGDEKGNTQSFCADTPEEMEEKYREAIGEMGEVACVAFTIEWTFVSEKKCPLFSLSRLRNLGNTVFEARKKDQDPVESIIEHENGTIIFRGEVVEVKNGGGGGFSEGTIIIEGSRPEAKLNEKLYIPVKNENYLAYVCDVKGEKTYLAAAPNLISLVKEDGSAITTEMVQKDLHVSVIVMPCNPLWNTEKGKKAGGPAAFGYHDDVHCVVPVGEYKYYPPIPLSNTDR
ncbi:uncharacterized protein [Acropora muricata]|uniref:uncharacterized protein n=1 Tax=Acropora muricata TaxID=159855 RepID=UPI0034E54C7A